MSGASRRAATSRSRPRAMIPPPRAGPTFQAAAGGAPRPRGGGALPGHPGEPRHALPRRVPVALDLAGGDRRRHPPAVLVEDGVVAVLPALVLGADGRLGQVLEIPVAVAVAAG